MEKADRRLPVVPAPIVAAGILTALLAVSVACAQKAEVEVPEITKLESSNERVIFPVM